MQRLLAASLVWSETSRFSEFGFEGVGLADVRVSVRATPAMVAQCREAVDRLCRPCGAKVAGGKLTELLALTVSRSRSDVDREAMAVAYTQRLAQYPEDVVVRACDRWADREEFWPSWAEIKGECDKLMRGRAKVREALNAWQPPQP